MTGSLRRIKESRIEINILLPITVLQQHFIINVKYFQRYALLVTFFCEPQWVIFKKRMKASNKAKKT